MDSQELSNYTYDKEVATGLPATNIAHDVVFVLFCILGICADAAIAFTILRFKKMRTIPNILLLNWAIADLCSLLFAPSGYRIISVLDHISMSHEVSCVLLQFGSVFHLTAVIFPIISSVDWFIAAYFPQTSDRIRSYHRYILSILWTISVLSCGITTGLCIAHIHIRLIAYLLLASICLLLIIIIILQSCRAVCKYYLKKPIDQPSLMLTLSTAYVSCCSLGIVTSMSAGFLMYHPLMAIVVECLLFSSSVVNFIILYFTNQNFQACIFLALTCSGSGYEQPINNFETIVCRNPIVKYNSSVEISYEKQNKIFRTNVY